MKPASKFVFNSYVFKKSVAQLRDISGGAYFHDHDLMGNKLRNFSKIEVVEHPFLVTHLAGTKKKFREEIELIIFFKT